MNIWTMHVEKFGKIEKADIEVAPMTLFVGNNNSGKSYVMTLIYGLIRANFYYDQYQFPEQSACFKKCMAFVDKIYDSKEVMDPQWGEIAMTCEDAEAFEEVLNELLLLNKERFIEKLFNKRIDVGSLSLEFNRNNQYRLSYTFSAEVDQSLRIVSVGCGGKELYGCVVEKRRDRREYNQMISYIISYMIEKDFGNPIYFPTARTGYVLTYKSLIGSAVKDKFNLGSSRKNLLTRPNSDFLEKLSGITGSDPKDDEWDLLSGTRDAVNIIENHIIQGKVSVSDMPTQDILYRPQGTEVQLPMFVSSGVITEMTPLLIFFKNELLQTVLIEEPEISLHPQLQCEMARVLIRLVNAGISVFATTHSDIILQQINNMIKLAGASNREAIGEKLGYEACDWIDKEKINVYQFDVDESHRTMVTKLSCGEYGFEAMTFYNTLKKLNWQTMIIEEE